MKLILLLTVAVCLGATVISAAPPDTRIYELRIYKAAPGKLDALIARFRDHTVRLFEKHGLANVGYWVPIDNNENKLVYMISAPNREVYNRSFAAFASDPETRKAMQASEANGRIMAGAPQTTFLTATDYSPEIKPAAVGDRIFELRTYTATPGKLDNLNARFRDHTLKLFEKHGMTNIGYWTPVKGQRGRNDDTLIYFLSHKDQDAAKASWDAFRADADWVAAKKASEDKASGSLTIADGVKSEFLKPTDFSPIK